MATITQAQLKWLEGLGVDTASAGAATAAPRASALRPGAGPGQASSPAGNPPPPADDEYSAPEPPQKPDFLDFDSPKMKKIIRDTVAAGAEKDKQEAEQTLIKMNKVLAEVKAFVEKIPSEEMQKSSYAQIITKVRERFPEAANLSQWVKETNIKVPGLRGKLPSPKAVIKIVEDTVRVRGAALGWSLSTGKDLSTVASDLLLAAYMSELPGGVTVDISGGVVKLDLRGAALAVPIPGGQVDATADKGGSKVVLKNKDFSIQVANEGWKEFDPELRGRWQKIANGTTTVVSLQADMDKAKLELDQKKDADETLKATLTADFKKKEAEFNLAWKKLQEEITVTAKATEEKITASVVYLKKDKKDKESVKAGVDAELDLKAMQAKLKAYYASPTVKAALEVTAAADKVTAKLELTAVKSGVVVTTAFEQALDETKVALEVMAADKDMKTGLAVELKKKADDLTAKLKLVHESKDMKLALEPEKTLKEVRAGIELQYKKGGTAVTVGGSGSTDGKVEGKVQIDIALKDGRTFVNNGDKLSFVANVSTSGYNVGVVFSMGEPVETASLQDLFKDADTQIKELYKLAGDKGVRSIEDAAALNAKLQEVMAPVKASVEKAKTLKKSAVAASFGFSLEGEWPAGGKASPPAALFSVKLQF